MPVKSQINPDREKGNTYFSKGNYASAKERYIPEPVEKFGYDKVQALAAQLIEGYEKGEFGELHIFFTKFHTVMQSFAMGIRLLPLEKDTFDSKGKLVGEYIIEPSVDQILEHLFPKYIETQIYQCILESLTSEFAARRVAMIAATENAGEMIDELTHTYQQSATGSNYQGVVGSYFRRRGVGTIKFRNGCVKTEYCCRAYMWKPNKPN